MKLIAIFLPPLAVLLCGKPLRATITLLLQVTVIGWILATIYAWSVVNAAAADRRTARITRAIQKHSG